MPIASPAQRIDLADSLKSSTSQLLKAASEFPHPHLFQGAGEALSTYRAYQDGREALSPQALMRLGSGQ
jgi:hypothetical protein